MLKALPEPVRDPSQTLDAWAALARRLADYGVRIRFGVTPPGMHSDWDSVTKLLILREGIDLVDQVWLLQQYFNFIAMGPRSAPLAVRKPILTLVPAPRGPMDAETA